MGTPIAAPAGAASLRTFAIRQNRPFSRRFLPRITRMAMGRDALPRRPKTGRLASRPYLRLLYPCNPYHYIKKSRISDKIFAAKERKEHRDNDLCSFFFVIFVFFCGNSLFGCGFAALGNPWFSSFGCGWPRCASCASLRLFHCIPSCGLLRNSRRHRGGKVLAGSWTLALRSASYGSG